MRIFTLIVFLFLSYSLTGQVNLTNGLVAYYPFNGNANDASGNGNNPVFNNATLTSDRLGNPNSAYHFNGVNNFIKIPNSTTINTSNQISLNVWIKPMGFYQGTCHGNSILMKGDADFLTGNYLLRFDDNFYTNGQNCSTPVVDIIHQNFFGNGTGVPPPGYTPYIQTGQWYSVTYTYDGAVAKLYVNCQLKATVAVPNLSFTNGFDLFLGRLNDAQYPYWLNGDLDEVRIYNRPLNQEEVNVLGGCTTNTTSCNNWLKTPSYPSSVSVGDLDIVGNQLTVEANFTSTTALNPSLQWGKLVSKHTGPADVNYSLMAITCEITTTNGYINTPAPCAAVNDKTYHVAMVYNGTVLKFYRNGFLLSSIPWTGNLVNNDLLTTIASGPNNPGVAYQQLGYINEVRIWNVARTQAEIKAYMNTSLPNPTTQVGLRGYYTFDNLINKQGNAAYNGTLNGTATINETNPNCSFVADSCNVLVPTGVPKIINDYTPVLGLEPCKNIITVENATAYNVGDTVLLIQMKGAVIDSTNTANFGTITDYKSAGNYEYNYVKSKNGNAIELKNKLLRTYEIPTGKVQLIRVPYYQNYSTTGKLTCLPWNGTIGGVLVFNVANTLTLNDDIDVSGKGFRGGRPENFNSNTANCNSDNFFYPLGNVLGAAKGEGIAEISSSKQSGKGRLANGGGGGNDHNAGGGGGSNSTLGGAGGKEYNGCTITGIGNGGISGLNLNNNSNKIFLGGGGGSGHANNSGVNNFTAAGGNGGGIVIINSNILNANGFKITNNGANAAECIAGGNCNDGAGGGGGGGTILLDINTYSSTTPINSNGGHGASTGTSGTFITGPGGGGSGGMIWLKQNSTVTNAQANYIGGINGVNLTQSNNPWGATSGQSGQSLFNLVLPVSSIPFKPNIDSVKIKDSITACSSFDFKGFGFTNTTSIPSNGWQWFFGDGGTASTQNTAHTYTNAGNFTVKLVVTDINGCKDSIVKNVIANQLNITVTPSDTICHDKTKQLNATGGISYTWLPTQYLSNPNIANPVATPLQNITYYVTITSAQLCTKKDSVTIIVKQKPLFSITASKDIICAKDSVQFVATGGNIYTWTPANSLNNSTIANPIGTPSIPTLYQVQIVSSACNDTANFTKPIQVNPLPTITVSKSNDIDCIQLSAKLLATGGNSYTWSPTTGLSNSNSNNPTLVIGTTDIFTVKVGNSTGCFDTTSVTVYVTKDGKGLFLVPTVFTPNGDGINDCFGISHWGAVELKEFSVFDRWGKRIFYTTRPSACWDGTYKGQKLDIATFVYQIRASSFCGEIYRKGTIVLAK
jgi:gliding motility-associated-like protein